MKKRMLVVIFCACGITASAQMNPVIQYELLGVPSGSEDFTELAVWNDGAVGGYLEMTLQGDVFNDPDGDDRLDIGSQILVQNVPPGLTPSIVLSAQNTVAILHFTGVAVNHENIDDVESIVIVFTDMAFATETSINVERSTWSSVGIDFNEVVLIYPTTVFNESTANDGTIANQIKVTLAGGQFVAGSGVFVQGVHYIAENVPAGFLVNIHQQSANVVLVSLSGTSTVHSIADNIDNLRIYFFDAAFATLGSCCIENSIQELSIQYRDNRSTGEPGYVRQYIERQIRPAENLRGYTW